MLIWIYLSQKINFHLLFEKKNSLFNSDILWILKFFFNLPRQVKKNTPPILLPANSDMYRDASNIKVEIWMYR